jgi:hypothetical protein
MKPAKKTIIDELINDMSVWISSLGFEYKKSHEAFIHRDINIVKKICIDMFSWPQEEFWNLNFQLNVRFTEVENILNKYKPYISKSESKKTVTIARSMIDLCPASPFKLRSGKDVRDYRIDIKERIEKFAMPYLHKNSSLSSVREAFESEESQWPVRSPIIRCEVLLVIYALQNEWDIFDSSVNDFEDIIKNYRDGFHVSDFKGLINGLRKERTE